MAGPDIKAGRVPHAVAGTVQPTPTPVPQPYRRTPPPDNPIGQGGDSLWDRIMGRGPARPPKGGTGNTGPIPGKGSRRGTGRVGPDGEEIP